MDFEEFTKFVAKWIFENQLEEDPELFCEVACRKLVKLGLVEVVDGE